MTIYKLKRRTTNYKKIYIAISILVAIIMSPVLLAGMMFRLMQAYFVGGMVYTHTCVDKLSKWSNK